jgi:hypothetical protein
MAKPLGWRLYRGLLKTGARVWNPTEIRDADVLRKVLAQMQAAERSLRRLEAALDRVGPENSGSDSPLLATQFAQSSQLSGKSQEGRARS